jgi:hypothetical protein
MSALERVRRLNRSIDAVVRRRGRKRTLVMATTAAAAIAFAAVGVVTLTAATAGNTIEGKPIDAAHAQTIMLAGLSCPVVTGPRLAGVMMAGSGMNFDASNGVAGLPSSTFKQWAPWPNASVTDPDANIYALAHTLCALSGEVRRAGADGDSWNATLAAYRSGVPAVAKSGKLPAETQKFVNTVNGYAAWYDKQPGFSSDPAATPDPTDSAAPAAMFYSVQDPLSMPNEYATLVASAGKHCEAITPAMLAGQLSASSNFNPNLRGSTDAMGIAQFLPSMWTEFAPSVKSSPWDPETAIGVLASTMCDLTHQFAGISGANSYAMALAAFRVGDTAVRQAGGVPQIPSVQQFITQVETNTRLYDKDTRLAPTPQLPSGTPTKTPSATIPTAPATTGPVKPTPTTTSDPANPPTKPTDKPTTTKPTTAAPPPAPSGQIVALDGLCVDVPSSDTRDGNPLQVWGCDNTDAQTWTVGKDGTLRAFGKCMDVYHADTANNSTVHLWTCHNTPSQKWVHRSDGTLFSEYSNKCLDAYSINYGWGSHLAIWDCNHSTNQQFKLPS